MKKLFLSLILMTSVFTLVHAQGVDFGIKAGLNMAKLGGDVENVDLKAGLHAGLFANLKFSDKFAISPELLFSQQGGDMDGESLKLNYVNIPLLAKINFSKFINVHFGPQFGFLMSAKVESEDIKELYKSTDLSIVGGLGLDLPMGIIGGVRYNMGLANIAEELPIIGEVKTTNQYFQVYLGYKLF